MMQPDYCNSTAHSQQGFMYICQDWTDALTAFNESFYGLNKDLNLGCYNVFGTGSGDQMNPAFIPQNQTGEVRVANPSYAADILRAMTGFQKRHLGPYASLDGLKQRPRRLGIYFQYGPDAHHPE